MARGRTSDTERALEAIGPMAKTLNIKVEADGNFLYCNGQPIGIGCNSTYATIMEFVGYVFAVIYTHDRIEAHGEKLPREVADRIKRYWFSKEQWMKVQALTEE